MASELPSLKIRVFRAMKAASHITTCLSQYQAPVRVEIASIAANEQAVSTFASRARRMFSFPVALSALLAATVFGMANRGLADPDIWWHLRNAEYLLTQRKWLRLDLYSYSVYGHPWINHEWLAEIPYYIAWRAFGLLGIQLLSLVILESIFLGLFYLCWRTSGNIKASAVACYFAVFLGTVSYGPRTLLFGYSYLLALLIVLERFRSRGRAALWALPPLFCLWANSHGSWSLGLIVFAVFIGCGLVEVRWGRVTSSRWSRARLRRLGVAMGLSIGALFVNPYGYKLVLYPLDLALHQKLNVAHVAEWMSVDFHGARGKVALLLLVALLLGALLSRYRWQLHELALVLFGAYAGLTYVRFLFLAGILAAPLLAGLLSFLPPYRAEIDKPILNALIVAGALTFMIGAVQSKTELEASIDREYPRDVLPYLRAHPLSGPVLNYYLWGGYLGWQDHNFKDFVDSRVDVFEYAGVFQDYLDLLELKDPAAILDKYRIRYVLFPPGEPLTYALQHDSGWRTIFKGEVSILFERTVAASPADSLADSGSQR